MDCSSARAALSARLDGELPAPDSQALDRHLAGCAACREWGSQVADVTRRLLLQPVVETPDLSGRVLAGMREDHAPRAGGWPPERWLLLVVGVVMLAFAVPMVVRGHVAAADVHLVRESGVTDLALAVGVLYAALQPWRAAGMLPVVVVLAAGLTLTSADDVWFGRVAAVHESVHLLAPTAAVLLWRLRRRGPAPQSPPAHRRLHAVDEERRTA